MPDKPWLGAQEAHYASLLWHLDVPNDYTSQIDATRSVFPGKAMVNVNQTPINHAQVKIQGHAQAWITDMECATSFRPKMYGFDFARVTEVFLKDGERRLIVEEDQDKRINHTGLPGERAMMKDLMLSSMREGGEVSMTYHMLNPFLPKQTNVTGDKIGDMLGFAASETINDLFASALSPAAANAKGTIEHNARLLGAFLDEVLASPHSNSKNIWLRLLHEPNINYFWWGHPRSVPAGDFYENFAKLWNLMLGEILSQIDPTRRGRLKLAFSINGEEDKTTFPARLDQYFPTSAPPGYAADYLAFVNSINVLGLDYYEDWEKEYTKSVLPDEYEAIKAKASSMNGNSSFDTSWEHALTEVSIRTKFKGKLYGYFDDDNQPDPEANAWPSLVAGVRNRRFFEEIVYKLVEEHQPKWVLFWVNRVGNAILSSFEPTSDATANGVPEMFYDRRTNVFDNKYVEHYIPIFPAEPFVVETYKAGDDSGAKAFFPISQTEQIPLLPGGGAGADQANHIEPYKDAIVDFFQMVPQTRRTANAASYLEVEKFLSEPTLPRPVLDPSATPAQQADLLFEVL